ncbi:MAG TPA: hypothetical protein RMH85_29255 [Polyangiaceae bacterium LLY-WYZ-15_(1-7)]|nr:hypothetical protein [Myxococcales bacterium]MAT28005.1 hypothetical protein [Sandaracinus sp.]HJK95002.1 hypothetical protein [Polyangiaceae bacterium LLY-WYZ-15_(1-7)]MBJ70966.1 hypothetical protein [Sandaracinus sp.]HJL02789.1 hypothetical protein [Polyangiaceae bacterium LLY-WYZ-15_(1-7)]
MIARLAPCFALTLTLALAGCEDEEQASAAWQVATWPEPMDEDVVLDWQVRDLRWGSESFTVHRDGSSLFQAHIEGGATIAVDRRLPPAELEALHDRLAEAGCCELASVSTSEENIGQLHLRMPGLDCDVVLPLEQWDDERPDACEDALRAVHGRARFRQ